MLAIRMQRTGRRGHAMFRVIVQDSRYTPTSGNVVANLGHYDPHTKAVVVDKEKASLYISNGAQPSERVARMLKKEGVKLPDWVKISPDKQKKQRNPEKLRKDQPKEEKVESKVEDVPEDKVEDKTEVTTTETEEVKSEELTGDKVEASESKESDQSDDTSSESKESTEDKTPAETADSDAKSDSTEDKA